VAVKWDSQDTVPISALYGVFATPPLTPVNATISIRVLIAHKSPVQRGQPGLMSPLVRT